MSDILVLYFSRSGVTEALARELAAKLGADIERVTPLSSYAGAGGWIKGVWQSLRGAAPPVASAAKAGNYALVVIGAPVWAGRLAPPMRSYLQRTPPRGERLAAFWTSGGGAPYAQVGAEIARLTGKRLETTASFSQRDVQRGATERDLEAFASALRPPPLPRAAA